jgi:hypothetical protein
MLVWIIGLILIYSMEKSLSWDSDYFSANQKISLILWNPKFHYRHYKRRPPVPIASACIFDSFVKYITKN